MEPVDSRYLVHTVWEEGGKRRQGEPEEAIGWQAMRAKVRELDEKHAADKTYLGAHPALSIGSIRSQNITPLRLRQSD